jgi:hypothetical protein
MKAYLIELKDELEELQFIIAKSGFTKEGAQFLHDELREVRKEINEKINVRLGGGIDAF